MKTLLTLFVLLFSSSVFGDNYVCISEKVTGFNYVNENWQPTNFNNIFKYKIKKRPKEECSAYNYNKNESEDYITDVYKFLYNECYVVKEFESTESDFPTFCSETYNKNEYDEFFLRRVDCRNFSFSPDGDFIKSFTHGMVLKEQKERDSIYLAVGQCSKF